MTVRGPIASLPLVAEPGPPSSPDQFLVQTASFTDSDAFFTHTVFRGAVTLPQDASFIDPDTFFIHALTGGTVLLSQTATFIDSDTFFTHIVAGGDAALTQTATFNDADTFFTHLVLGTGDQVVSQNVRYSGGSDLFPIAFLTTTGGVPVTPEHPDTRAPFPPDGGNTRRKPKQNVRIKWRDTVAEAEARLVEEQRLAEIAQLAAFEAYLIKRRKIAAATALLMS